MNALRPKQSRPRMWDSPKIVGILYAIALVVTGFGAIGLAWRGTARILAVGGQIPWVVSGGMGGLGLIGTGLGLLLTHQVKNEGVLRSEALNSLLGEALDSRFAPALMRRMSASSRQVVVGSSAFHLPSCRFAQRDGLRRISRAMAQDLRLSPCRACKPDVGRVRSALR